MTADYDRSVDVLYVMLNPPVAVEGDGRPGGVELDYSQKDGSPCGVTVIGYKKNGWPQKVSALASIIGNHLTLKPQVIKSTIEKVMD